MGDKIEKKSCMDRAKSKSVLSIFRNMRKKKRPNLKLGGSVLFNQLLKPVALESGGGELKYGDVVQLVSGQQVLAITVKDEDYNKFDRIPRGSFLTVSDDITPCVRNSFSIDNPWKDVARGSTVNYGDDFALATIAAAGVPKLYVGADYPFGALTLKAGHSSLRMTPYPDNQCKLKIRRADLTERRNGAAVDTRKPFRVLSSATDRSLVVNRACKVVSILGLEKEVSFHYTPTWFSKNNEGQVSNLWKINSTDTVR